MMLWDIIRDFFVQYIFGGITTNGDYYSGLIGHAYLPADSNYYDLTGDSFYIGLKGWYEDGAGIIEYISFADWLSTTATIITLCAICFFLFLFVRWLFRLTAGLVSGRG